MSRLVQSQAPDAIEWELEIVMAGMGEATEEGMTLSDTLEGAAQWDVELQLRFEQTGEVEIIYEKSFKHQYLADHCFAMLENMFPDASHNIVPD